MLSLLKTVGTKIVNEQNEEVILRGVGLGNWLLPEGYMWLFGETPLDRPRKIEAFITELIGEEDSLAFWDAYYANYITQADIRQIKQMGFNSIRLPINYRFMQTTDGNFIPSRLNFIDNVVEWCEIEEVYLILDLHGAPGGQTGANIDDSANDFPELFTNREYQLQTLEIWKEFARRYKDKTVVAGYDLLNEPLPSCFNQFNDELIRFYDELIAEVRAIDPHHIIILEGANWANDWSIFKKPYENVVLQAHKYWNLPDEGSIAHFKQICDTLQSPLWMGETGENTTDWYTGSFQLLADHRIGYNLWPYKKMGKDNTPLTIKTPVRWDALIDCANQKITLTKEESLAILNEFLENIKTKNCIYSERVVNSVLKRAPLKIPAEFYSYLGEHRSYHSHTKKWNETNLRLNDNVAIQFLNPERIQDEQYQLNQQFIDYLLTQSVVPQTLDELVVLLNPLLEQVTSQQLDAFVKLALEKLNTQQLDLTTPGDYQQLLQGLNRAPLNYWHSRTESQIEDEQLVVELNDKDYVVYDFEVVNAGLYTLTIRAKGEGAHLVLKDNMGCTYTVALSKTFETYEINWLWTSRAIELKVECEGQSLHLDWLDISEVK